MRSIIDLMRSVVLFLTILSATMFAGCIKYNGNEDDLASKSIPFKRYVLADSTRIVTYPDGLKLYIVKAGSGDYPANGDNVMMHYQGTLEDGSVFDDSYLRGEPLEFKVGAGRVIAGMESAAKKLRLGSKAILVVPPSLGYGDGTGKDKLPPKIPANATLTFHIEMVGSF